MRDIPPSPFYIFVKAQGLLDSAKLFSSLGVKVDKSSRTEMLPFAREKRFPPPEVFYARLGEWGCVMDSFWYGLWHTKEVWINIERLGEKYEVFCFSVGDSDCSYDFAYYKDGKKVRELVIIDPEYNNPKVSVDFGDKLDGEKGTDINGSIKSLLNLGQSLGINAEFLRLPIERHHLKCGPIYERHLKQMEERKAFLERRKTTE